MESTIPVPDTTYNFDRPDVLELGLLVAIIL